MRTDHLGPDAEHRPADRARQDRRRDQQAELRSGQAQVLLQLDADDREDHPHGKTDGQRKRAEPQRTLLPGTADPGKILHGHASVRSEEHTSELQSLMRISYAVFCLTKKKTKNKYNT